MVANQILWVASNKMRVLRQLYDPFPSARCTDVQLNPKWPSLDQVDLSVLLVYFSPFCDTFGIRVSDGVLLQGSDGLQSGTLIIFSLHNLSVFYDCKETGDKGFSGRTIGKCMECFGKTYYSNIRLSKCLSESSLCGSCERNHNNQLYAAASREGWSMGIGSVNHPLSEVVSSSVLSYRYSQNGEGSFLSPGFKELKASGT
eukprot:Gb_08393 [translate_table: standard]